MNRFYIADTHFGHANILTFKRNDGTPLREFCCVDEMNEHMVRKWNEVVHPTDTVYHLGDVAINHKILPNILPRLNGRKILIKGNHDQAKLSVYAAYFADVRAYDRKDGIVASHVPIHPGSLERWGVNVHGHLHANQVTKTVSIYNFGQSPPIQHRVPDSRYFCVSVEQIDYTPIELGDLQKRIKERLDNEK